MTTQKTTRAAALAEARKNSPDWQEAHGLAFGLRMGQITLKVEGAKDRLAAMQPRQREALVALIQRWVELEKAADALVNTIELELKQEVLA